MRVYLDYAATTPVDSRVHTAMQPYFSDDFGNPNSVHQFGRVALAAIDGARRGVAEFLQAQPLEILFTAGATESNNLALRGLVRPGDHIITSQIEHPSVLEVCKYLETTGVAVTYVAATAAGIVDPQAVAAAVLPNTKLVSIMYANNEIGTIQPIAEVGQLIASLNHQRDMKIYFHTDAVQAAAYLSLDVNRLGVDLLSFSGHKIYGPKGSGVLFYRRGVVLQPLVHGGPQEFGLRAGTLNVAAIVGLAKACALVIADRESDISRIKKLRDRLAVALQMGPAHGVFNGAADCRLVNNIHCTFAGVEAQQALIALDQVGIAVSAGSACSAGSLAPSHVLAAIGMPPQSAAESIRITLGRFTTDQEITYAIKKIPSLVAALRQ